MTNFLLRVCARFACWVTRTIQDFPGRWRVVRWLHSHDDVLVALPPIMVRIAPGYHVEFCARSNSDVYIAGLTRDHPIPILIPKLVNSGHCVLDIGANVGLMTVLCSSLVGAKGQVHAFEASPEVLPDLERNLMLNRCGNVILHKCAVSDRCGEVEFHIPMGGRSALSSMRSLSSSEHVVQVPAKAIDSVMHELPPVRFVKIDVEGAESLVLQGMRKLIARDHPIVLLELTDNWLRQLGGSADDVCGSLREAGYILYAIGAGAPTRIDAVPREQIDMLCVTPDIERSLAIGGTLFSLIRNDKS